MPLDELSLSKAKKAKKKHYLCFNALARAKSITEWKHWTFPKKSFNALTRAKCIETSDKISGDVEIVSMPSHGLSASPRVINIWIIVLRISMPSHGLNKSANLHQKLSFPVLLSLCTSPLYLKLPHPSITFHQIPQFFSPFPSRPTGANRSSTQSASLFHFQYSASRRLRIAKAP